MNEHPGQPSSGVLDSEGYAVCPDFGTRVNCGGLYTPPGFHVDSTWTPCGLEKEFHLFHGNWT
ncbi:hypothetical protein H0H92_004647 [Tricholoma furcatifolium]|nr:hypothetical protein H0H92_004647 [Tricholoma furcatifolium]